ncbi:MAG: hypothetical protein KAT05_11155, partial [Spirochaetes bacterium]|nr:hypothetical protein [Spirochaetota bacterium]
DDAGDPAAGINRIRIYIKKDDGTTIYETWGTDTAEITPSEVLPYDGTNTVTWTLAAQDTSTINGGTDGNYLMVIEVQDTVGIITTLDQYVYIDNTNPTLTVDDPNEGIAVTGSFNINGTASDTGGLENNCVLIEIYNLGSVTDTTWNKTPSAGNWNQWWDTSSPANFDKVKVTLTDKALNQTVIERNISRDLSAPDFKAGTFFVADEDGVADLLTFSTFTDLYSEVSGSSVYLLKEDVTFDNVIEDDGAITDSGIYVSGEVQIDGSPTSEPYQSLDPSTDTAPAEVGGTSSYLYTGLSSGEYTYRVWVEQQSGAVEVNLSKKFVVDDQVPHIWIEDMQYSDSVGYGETTEYGHIEVNSTFDGADDDVSGVIYVDIKAFDNYLIDKIEVKCTDMDFGNGDDAWTTILDRNNNTGTWVTFNNGTLGVNADYWDCTLNPDEVLKANKNWVSLTFEFDTANVTNIIGLTKNLEFRATDIAGNMVIDTSPSSETTTDPITRTDADNDGITYIAPNSTYQQIVRKTIDVVPYITEIETELGIVNPTTPSITNRSALGRYPVYKDITVTDYESITIKGYNLVTSFVTIGPDDDGCNAAFTGLDTTTDTLTSAEVTANKEYSISVQNATRSGYINIIGNIAGTYIPAINNINDNTSDANKEANNYNNDILTDDRWLEVWEFNQITDITEARYVDMELAGNNVNFGMGYSDNYASVWQNGARQDVRQAYTRYFENKLAYNDDGTYFFVSNCGDTLLVPCNNWGLPSSFAFVYRTTPSNTWEYNGATNRRKIFIEPNWNGSDLNKLERCVAPDMKVKGDNTLSEVYLTYYDHVSKLIKFRYFQTGDSTNITGTDGVDYVILDINDSNRRTTLMPYNGGAVQWDSTEQAVCGQNTNGGPGNQGYVAIAGANENSIYSATAFTDDGTAIIVWFDSNNNSLKLKYNTSPSTSYSGSQEFDSTGNPTAGSYNFRLSVDGVAQNGGADIPITFGNSTNGDNKHEFAYQLNKVLSENYSCFAEVNPVTNRVIVRSFQTGAGSSISITAGSTNDLLAAYASMRAAVVGAGSAWVERTLDTDYAGKYAAIATDGGAKGGIHIAYYKTSTGDLKYAYLSEYDCIAGNIKVVTVDSFLQIGQYIDITTNLEDIDGDMVDEIVPYISYYNMSYSSTKLASKIAKLNVDPANIDDGVENDRYNGNWECQIIPAREEAKQYRVSIGFKDNGDLIVGYQGDLIEYGQYLPAE